MAKIDQDLIGKKFSRLSVIEYGGGVEKTYSGGSCWTPSWICRCICGAEVDICHYKLIYGHTRSCGCLRKENKTNLIHGDYGSKEYKIWQGIKRRCYNKNEKAYKFYGKKGIRMCREWKNSYDCFLKDMGRCPDGLSIGRINSRIGYSKKNCRWETQEQQANNRSNNKIFRYKGEKMSLIQYSRKYLVDYRKLINFIKHDGLSFKKAIERLIKQKEIK